MNDFDQSYVDTYGVCRCPHCNIHLENGVGEHMQEVNGVYIRHERFKYECLGCGEEFGPPVARRSSKPVRTVGPRPAMTASLKLDRRIVDADTGDIYKNACQVWRLGLVSSSQGDRLSALLYGAAKRGEFPTVNVNGRNFKLFSAEAK